MTDNDMTGGRVGKDRHGMVLLVKPNDKNERLLNLYRKHRAAAMHDMLHTLNNSKQMWWRWDGTYMIFTSSELPSAAETRWTSQAADIRQERRKN